LIGYILKKVRHVKKGCTTTTPGALPPVRVYVQKRKAEFQAVLPGCTRDIVEDLKVSGLRVEAPSASKATESCKLGTIGGLPVRNAD
jgi:hypothetical protein